MGGHSSRPCPDMGHDQAFTNRVIDAIGPETDPRVKAIMKSLVQHLHDFAREVDLTTEELCKGIELINKCGRLSAERDELTLLSDILGLESLVDSLDTKRESTKTRIKEGLTPTSSCILGPFYRPEAPELGNGSSIVSGLKRDEYWSWTTHLSGRVLDTSGSPIRGALVDIWHTAPNGMYEQQDVDQPDMDLRGRFRTDEEGKYDLYCLRPVSYPIPLGGPAEEILGAMHRHPWRPAHLHFIVSSPGYRQVVTQLFDSEDKHLVDDTVFAVKDDLRITFTPVQGDCKARFAATRDFVLRRDASGGGSC